MAQAAPDDRDYVLGTHDAEIERLAFQHRIWRSIVLATWRRAGISTGSSVLDVGAGPGLASLDLAEVVGPAGHVSAVERSGRFVAHLRAQLAARGLGNTEVHEHDLMTDALPGRKFDAAWCRWVASFVSSRRTLMDKISAALRPGGVLVLHEYVRYDTYGVVPRRTEIDGFVREIMASWRETGGEPDVIPELLTLLPSAGLEIVETTPRLFSAAPGTDLWNWPAGYVRVGSQRLRELGRVNDQWVEGVLAALASAERDPASRFITPMVLEVVARKLS